MPIQPIKVNIYSKILADKRNLYESLENKQIIRNENGVDIDNFQNSTTQPLLYQKFSCFYKGLGLCTIVFFIEDKK